MHKDDAASVGREEEAVSRVPVRGPASGITGGASRDLSPHGPLSSRPTDAAYPSRADRIRSMRADGMTLKAICDELGVAKSAVNRALYPRVREYEANYSRERWHTATCEKCGRPCTHNVYSKTARGRWCASCYRKHRKEALNAAA